MRSRGAVQRGRRRCRAILLDFVGAKQLARPTHLVVYRFVEVVVVEGYDAGLETIFLSLGDHQFLRDAPAVDVHIVTQEPG